MLQSFVRDIGRKIIIGVTFAADVTKLGGGICFCYFCYLCFINEIVLAIWMINFTDQHNYICM